MGGEVIMKNLFLRSLLFGDGYQENRDEFKVKIFFRDHYFLPTKIKKYETEST